MTDLMSRTRTLLVHLWRANAPLTAVGLLMIAALAVEAVGLWLDPRTIGGAPAWLKPAKFSASIAIFTLSLAWVFTYLPTWPRLRRIVGWTTALTLMIEIVVIGAQAWRGTTSHFNIGTPLDGVLFGIMGTAILVQTLASVAVAVALWRQDFADRTMGWALRLGLTISIIGASTGGLMTAPTPAQIAEARVTNRMAVAGAHTVGAPDGGPGLPGTGWSTEHGDLRVPHFLGLHALQALGLVGLVLHRRRWPETARVHAMLAAAGSYTALFGILLWQALRAQAVLSPDAAVMGVLILWAALSAAAAWLVAGRTGTSGAHALVY